MRKISSILLLIALFSGYACKKDKEEKEEVIPPKPGKYTLDDKSFDLDLGYYFYAKDPDSDIVTYQITFANKNVFGFSTDGELKDVNIVSFSIIINKDNSFTDGTFEFDESGPEDQSLYDMGVFGYGCTAAMGYIDVGENGNLYYQMDKGKIVLKKDGDKHTISFELELDDDQKLTGNFSGILKKSSTPISQ